MTGVIEPDVVEVAPLAGYTVGVTAARRREELGTALERRGAKVIYAPAIKIVPLEDDTELLAATERCVATPPDIVVATTGIGFRGWLDAAETWGLAEGLTAAMRQATLIARGPKATGAMRAGGLREAWSPSSESSVEVLGYLLGHHDVTGRRIAVQLHGEPLPDLVDGLRAAGADVIEVPVYRWLPPDDEVPLRRLIDAVVCGGVDALTFTSAPAATNLLLTAEQMGCADGLRAMLRSRALAVAVGPVTAAPLVRAGIPVVQPARARLGALVREVVERIPDARGSRVQVGGNTLEVRGHAALVNGALVPLPGAGIALLRELAARPGQVVSRDQLARALPGDSIDGHAVEVAIGRLRAALGAPDVITTVVKRGYRLAV
jgi:uroporphyrinogen-III synthase